VSTDIGLADIGVADIRLRIDASKQDMDIACRSSPHLANFSSRDVNAFSHALFQFLPARG
jgi:hypothetical protein